MRITQAQLRKIIKEEAARMKRGRMNEGLGQGVGSAELQTALDVICDGWKAQLDPGDPVMASGAAQMDWQAQCEAACEDLGKRIEALIFEIEDDLHNGDYGY